MRWLLALSFILSLLSTPSFAQQVTTGEILCRLDHLKCTQDCAIAFLEALNEADEIEDDGEREKAREVARFRDFICEKVCIIENYKCLDALGR